MSRVDSRDRWTGLSTCVEQFRRTYSTPGYAGLKLAEAKFVFLNVTLRIIWRDRVVAANDSVLSPIQ